MLRTEQSNTLGNTSADNWSELSRLAWETLISRLGIPLAELGWHGQALPAANQVAALSNDDWVVQYESIQEKLAKQQRKKGELQAGVFYTPQPVAAYLTRRSLGDFLNRASHNIDLLIKTGKTDAALDAFQTVQRIKIIDPACGTGVFLVAALKLLFQFYRQLGQQFPQFKSTSPARHSACHQVYGIDLDPVSIEICKLRLAQWMYWLDGQPSPDNLNLNATLFCGDTLQSNVFNALGEWDFILGNPPYVSQVRGQAQRFKELKTQNPDYYQPKMDLCDAFLTWAIRHVKPNGQLVYVLPEYWTQRSSSALVRADLWQKGWIREFWSLQESRLFPNAPGHHSSFLIWQKEERQMPNNLNQQVALGICGFGAKSLEAALLQDLVFRLDASSGKLLYGTALEMNLLQKLSDVPPLLQKNEIQQGIVIPQGRLKPSQRHRLPIAVQDALAADAGIFLLDATEIHQLTLTETERQCLKPYFQPVGFQPFMGFDDDTPEYHIIYGDLQTRTAMAQQPKVYSNLRAHLDQFQAINTSDFAPYGLHRSRQAVWFEDAGKILCPRQVLLPAFAVVDFPAYVNEGFYSIRPANQDPYFICGILNSQLAWFWFYKQKRKGHRLQIDKDVLSVFPAPASVTTEQREVLAKLARLLVTQQADVEREKLLNTLNQRVFQLYKLTPEEAVFIADVQKAILQGQ